MTTGNTSRNTPDRMDLPFVGLATLGRPACPDCGKFDDADVAVLYVSIDTASSYRVGTRFGPRAIREVIGKNPDAAFGNSRWDAAMLAIARHGFAVNPNPDLEEMARERGWTIYRP